MPRRVNKFSTQETQKQAVPADTLTQSPTPNLNQTSHPMDITFAAATTTVLAAEGNNANAVEAEEEALHERNIARRGR